MADPSSEEDGLLREWAPMTGLLQQIPLKAQRGIFTYDLSLTCVDALPDYIAVGTNLGLVYWYSRRKGDLQRLRCENTASAITCVKVISTVDYMVAAGSDQGVVTVFQIPKALPDCLPENMKPKRNKQVERYTISKLHTTAVTAIEWSLNGMKLFSGDKNGLVVLTEIDFYMHLSKSVELLNEKYEIVQLSYSQQLLLVSTLYRSIVCHRVDRWRVAQVGQKERKLLGRLGATFCQGSGRPHELVVYASRPGLRMWLADKNGIVQQTLIFKDTMLADHTTVPLINPAPAHVKQSCNEHQWGPLLVFKENLLLSYSSDMVYVVDPNDISVVAVVADLRRVVDVAVTKDEIFILEGDRSLVRIAHLPESAVVTVSGLKPEQYPDGTFMSIPVSLSDMSVASSLIGFTSKIKESAVVPSIPFLFNRANVGKEQDGWNVVVVADEAVELPPIVPIPTSSLTGLTVGKEVTIATADGMASTTDENKVYKEVYNRSQRGSAGSRRGSSYSHDSSRTEVLEKIGEQQFEDVVFKPKPKKKKKKKTVKSKHLMSGTESGSDTMSTNSVRSNTSDCEDPWSSERLAASSDWSSMSTWPSSGTNGGHAPGRSSSEETLVRLGDSIISEPGALPSDDCGSVDSPAVHERDGRPPDELPLSADNNHIPTSVKPDLRSPATIERDVAAKEWLLAAVFNLDPLHVDEAANAKAEKVSQPSTESCSPTAESVPLGIVCESSANEANFNPCDDGILGCQEDRLGSLGSTLSYGPPSGSSAPPSVPASLELCQSEDTCETDTFQIFQSVDRSDCWVQYRTPDGVVGLSVCQHYVCCIDSRDALHYSSVDGLGLKWKKVDDRAEQVALSPSGALVWKLRKGTAYALQNPSQKGPFGEEWVKAACDVQSIAVDVATAWFVSLESQIYVQKKLTADKPCSTSVPVFCVLPATKVSCFNGSVWILTSNGKVLYRSGISSSVPEGKEWKEVSVPFPVMDISLGCQGTGWVVEAKNVVHFTKDFTVEDPQWWQILISDCIFQPTTSLQHLCTKLTDSYLKNLRQSSSIIMAAADNTMWMSERMANNVHVNKTEFTGHQWNRIHLPHLHPGFKWHKVTAGGICGDKGCLWLLSEAGDFFCSEPSLGILQTLPLPENIPFICISATPQAVWVLSVKGSIYVYQLMDTKSHSVNGVGVWNKINLTQLGGIRLVHLSCNSDYAWACSDQGEVYMTIGSPRSMISSTFAPAWIPVDEQPDYKVCFTKVYMGPEGFMVWALDKKRNVFVRTSIVPEYPLGRGWSLVSGIEAVELTISGTAVWALSPGGSVYRRYGITQNHCTGDYWKKIPGCVESLTASVNDELWALDRKSLLLLHSQVAVTLCANNTGNELTSILNVSLDSDWEHIDKE